MTKLIKTIATLALAGVGSSAYAFTTAQIPGHLVFEGGAYYSSQGQNQNVNITGLIGDHFSVTNRNDWAATAGLGYLFDGPQWNMVGLQYGINGFFLSNTKVSGTITQEQLFTNLQYTYNVNHLPIYAVLKALFNAGCEHLKVTMEGGIGPNFMNTTDYTDKAYNNNFTLPDHAFKGHASVVFSAMAGIGLQYQLTNTVPLEIGYRFFYLGQGYLAPANSAVLNNLKTGTNFAHGLMFTVTA